MKYTLPGITTYDINPLRKILTPPILVARTSIGRIINKAAIPHTNATINCITCVSSNGKYPAYVDSAVQI